MKSSTFVKVGILTLVLATVGSSTGLAGTVSYVTPASNTNYNAEADFTFGNGTVTVVLTNFFENANDDGGLISGIQFGVTGATGSTASITSSSGTTANVKSKTNGSLTNFKTGQSLAKSAGGHWVAGGSGTTVILDTVKTGGVDPGGKPADLIIGPDSSGKLNASAVYTGNGLASIFEHDPIVLGSATFTLKVAGVTSTSSLIADSVDFEFGTGPTGVAGVPKVPTIVPHDVATPEPASVAVWGALGLAGIFCWRRRKAL